MSKILVCILAQTRSHEVTWKNFKKNVLDELNADLALCIGTTKKYNYNNPFWTSAKYKWNIEEFGDDYSTAFDFAQNKICENSKEDKQDWRILLNIKDFWLGGIKGFTTGYETHSDEFLAKFPEWKKEKVGSSSILIFYRWLLLQKLRENNLIEKYDRFIITRSDFFWPIKHPPIDLMKKNCIWIPDGEGYGGITDRYALTNKEDISDYLSILDPILTQPKNLYNLMKNKNNWNLEKYINLHLKQRNLKKKIKYFPYIMYTVFPNPQTTEEFKEFEDLNLEWMKTIYSKDKISSVYNFIIKKPSEYLSSVLYTSILKKKKIWGNMNMLKIKYIFLTILLFLNKKKLFNYIINDSNLIDWNLIDTEINNLKRKGGFLNYIKNKYYF
tara:strand:- start:35 stop:1189 length:1155 start_codon:yes stop_codon:yes gene_type:complete